ncbi:MAG: hypothetical protein KDI55_29950, partial [Anaerolineae bacterium]|nr:hypothetical protein [Anaerolineae bacterium]
MSDIGIEADHEQRVRLARREWAVEPMRRRGDERPMIHATHQTQSESKRARIDIDPGSLEITLDEAVRVIRS